MATKPEINVNFNKRSPATKSNDTSIKWLLGTDSREKLKAI